MVGKLTLGGEIRIGIEKLYGALHYMGHYFLNIYSIVLFFRSTSHGGCFLRFALFLIDGILGRHPGNIYLAFQHSFYINDVISTNDRYCRFLFSTLIGDGDPERYSSLLSKKVDQTIGVFP
jgi:hypothetical protein